MKGHSGRAGKWINSISFERQSLEIIEETVEVVVESNGEGRSIEASDQHKWSTT